MKCSKCGYLGFDNTDRCRNCGYDFSLAPTAPVAFDLALESEPSQPRPNLDLDRMIGLPEPGSPVADLPLFSPQSPDAPLIAASRPRAPLGVRRATPEVPRARVRAAKPPSAEDTLFERLPATVAAKVASVRERETETLAAPTSRVMAALIDAALLSMLDWVVVYFTLRLCGLTGADIAELPVLPMLAFFLLLNGGYFVAFTTVGGQSIGKMALGIKVITQDDSAVPVGQATLRTLAYLASALPLGAGFLPGVMSADRLALHDRLAHTRVVRPST